MAISNHERVGKALELLNQGLRPFIDREMRVVRGEGWLNAAVASLPENRQPLRARDGGLNLDTQVLLSIMWDGWNEVFRNVLGHAERSLVSELRETRNRWAHQEAFSADDAYRSLDSVQRLLEAVSAEEAREVERQKQELLRIRFEEQTRRETRRAATAPIEGQPQGGLKPWRQVVTPHPDVASGRYQQAEFAADLAQVHRGEGAAEYRDPREFYHRTFLTEGLRHLLTDALQRLAGTGGDPVVELQTNFGGGKTHSLLALYHLFSGTPASELAGIEPVLQDAAVGQPPTARRAVLVGTSLSPARLRRKPDGVEVRTLWGEMAWQIGGKDGYSLVAEADAQGVSPGSEALKELFDYFSPCLVLIDEWVAFVRQLYGVQGLPAGSFDANLTFAQSLTEAARQSSRMLLVATVPASDIEIGGEAGKEALKRLKNTFERIESPWRPASTEEGFEIVRRRLFQPITEPEAFVARDAVARAFADLYRTQPGEFPASCREGDYERRIKASYPIHPELFDRLYGDWATLDRFQRTRGVLRLAAAVIHTLWERQDGSLLIMPASVPVDEPAVQFELTRYLEDPWTPIIEKEVDGATSLPMRLDRENPNLGRYSASRRVARALYLGSAPKLHTPNQGLEDNSIKLGCVQPGEVVATFGDALRRLTDQANHIYVNGRRYWYSTQPSVGRLAADRAEQQAADAVIEEIKRRLRAQQGSRGEFGRVHVAPPSSADVPDDAEARLVILGPEYSHKLKEKASSASKTAAEILDQRGTAPRTCRNMLVFLAPDRSRLEELEKAVRLYVAWKSIEDERDALNLDAFQSGQAKSKREQWDETVNQRIPEAYQWLLVPGQSDPTGPVEWQELRLQGDSGPAIRASQKLKNDGLLIPQYGSALLRLELDRIPLWRGEHVGIKQLWEDFAQYLYLPRLTNSNVLLASIQEGASKMLWETEAFAYAEGWDAARSRYLGLRAGPPSGGVIMNATSLVVKPEAARRQMEADEAAKRQKEAERQSEGDKGSVTYSDGGGANGKRVSNGGPDTEHGGGSTVVVEKKLRRFHGSVTLDATRLGRDAGKIAEEVIAHLSGLRGSTVEITLEIEADVPDGAPDNVVRTVTENCRTLKFKSHGFEET